MKVAAAEWLKLTLDFLLPRHCVACGLPSGPGNLCEPCNRDLPRIRNPCLQCGAALSLHSDRFCGGCLAQPPPWNRAVVTFDYRFPVNRLVCRFKFNRDLAAGQALGRELCDAIREANSPLPNLIIPVPLHRYRLIRRSFNQAERIAVQVGRALDIRVDSRALARCRPTPAQSGLSLSERKRNVRGAFRSRGKLPEHVAIVDDVMTSGTTLGECTRVLRSAGVRTITVWALARA